jgi:hypothetical protein
MARNNWEPNVVFVPRRLSLEQWNVLLTGHRPDHHSWSEGLHRTWTGFELAHPTNHEGTLLYFVISGRDYLVHLNPKIIKIDRYFVNPPNDSAHNETLLETIVSLGDKLQMTMLAEGIETQPQLDLLRDLKCELGQGYLFSPAVPADQAKTMVGKVFGNKESIIGEQIQGVSAWPTCERHPPSEPS